MGLEGVEPPPHTGKASPQFRMDDARQPTDPFLGWLVVRILIQGYCRPAQSEVAQ
jgi:hypothetical protein